MAWSLVHAYSRLPYNWWPYYILYKSIFIHSIDQLSYSNESRFVLAIFTSKQQTYWPGCTREVGCFLPMWARSWQDLFVPALSPPATCLSVTKTGDIRPHCMTTTSGTCNWGQNIRSWWIVLHVLAFNCFGDLVAVESRTYDIINNYIIIINQKYKDV